MSNNSQFHSPRNTRSGGQSAVHVPGRSSGKQPHSTPSKAKDMSSNKGNEPAAAMAGPDITRLLENMSKKMDCLSSDINEMKDSMKMLTEIKEDLASVKKTASDAYDIATENEKEICGLKIQVQELATQVGTLIAENTKTKKVLEKTQDDHARLDTYIRRDNLIFQNVPQSTKDENCEEVLRRTLHRMNVNNPEAIQFARVHRIKGKNKNPPSLICRFEHFADRMKVWQCRFNLKQTNILVQEDFHPDIQARRQILYPILREAKNLQMKCTMTTDKLIIDGQLYTVDTLEKLPDKLASMALGLKQTDDAVAFFSERCPLSNFFKAPFAGDDGNDYFSSEQFLQYKKAEFSGDMQTAAKILNAKESLQCKNLAKSIRNVNEKEWENVACKIMKSGLRNKFLANPICKKTLLDTGNRKLGEATRNDLFWGTGVALSHGLATQWNNWTGQNNMGKLLEELRQELQ